MKAVDLEIELTEYGGGGGTSLGSAYGLLDANGCTVTDVLVAGARKKSLDLEEAVRDSSFPFFGEMAFLNLSTKPIFGCELYVE